MRENQSMSGVVDVSGTLSAVLIRGDGSHRDYGELDSSRKRRLLGRPVQWWRALWSALKRHGIIPATLGFAAFLSIHGIVDHSKGMVELFRDPRVREIILGLPVVGLVVQNGANFLATDFASGQASPRISSMNFHDSGTGTIAATSTDSGLGTQAGPATRATGVQSNPTTDQYRSVGTIAYTTGLAITEWGLFSASTSGTMWDRRVFGAINVVNGDSIQYTLINKLGSWLRKLAIEYLVNCWKAYSSLSSYKQLLSKSW